MSKIYLYINSEIYLSDKKETKKIEQKIIDQLQEKRIYNGNKFRWTSNYEFE